MSDKEISKIDTSDKQSLKGIETARSNVTANASGVSSAKKRASYPYDGRGGIVQDRPYPPPSERLRSAATPAATPHPVKFSGPGDAVNAHADADHGAILVVAQVRVIFWGTEWASASPPVSMATVMGDVKSILGVPYLDGLAQYDVDRAFVSQVHELTDEDPPIPSAVATPPTASTDLSTMGSSPNRMPTIHPRCTRSFFPP